MSDVRECVPDIGGASLPGFLPPDITSLNIKCLDCESEDFELRLCRCSGFARASSLACRGCGAEADFDGPLRQKGIPTGVHEEISSGVAEAETRSQGAVVYFIGADQGPVKIGTTSGSVKNRLSGIQTGHPHRLRVLAVADGGYELESAFHLIFAPNRLHGEWFDRTPQLDRLISAYRRQKEANADENS